MAIFHKSLKGHPDKVEKHQITEGEIDFLLELQKEMNTQDTLCQADPRYWVIKGTEKEYGIEAGFEDGAELIETESNEKVADDMATAMAYIRDNLLEEINETDGVDRKIRLEKGYFHDNIWVTWNDGGYEDGTELENMSEVADWLNENGYDFRVANYRSNYRIYQNTMFLTQKAAEEHLKKNHYHYSEDAHTYAMTSWRNPETERLWKILHEVDWRRLKDVCKKGG